MGKITYDLSRTATFLLSLNNSTVMRVLAEQGVIYFDAHVSGRAFDLGMSKQKVNGPEISGPPVGQGSFCAS
jgi:hypothetical protein